MLLFRIPVKLKPILKLLLAQAIYSLPILYQYYLHNLRQKFITLKEWCQQVETFPACQEITQDWYLSIEPSKNIERKLPISIDNLEIDKFQTSLSYYTKSPELFLACIHQAKIFNKNDIFIALSSKQNIFTDVFWNHHPFIEGFANNLLDTKIFPSLKYQPGIFCILATSWPSNYYHWMIDILPKLYLIEQFKELESISLIVPEKLNTFQKQSLEIAGIKSERLLRLNSGYYQFDRLYFPSYISLAGSSSKKTVSWLRTKFLNNYFTQQSLSNIPYVFLYLTRRDANSRRVINEHEIIEFLQGIGFEIVCPGQLSLMEQIDIFRKAKVVIAPHGAGLTNIVFSPPSTVIIEMFPETEDPIDGCYWSLAEACGHNYAFLTGSLISNRDNRISEQKHQDFYVSLDKLKFLLEKVLCNNVIE